MYRNRSMLALLGAVVLDLARSSGVRGEHVEELEARLVDEAAGYDDAATEAEPVAGLGMSRLIGTAHTGLPPAIVPAEPVQPFTPVEVPGEVIPPITPEPELVAGLDFTPPAPEELAPAEPEAPAEPVPEDPAPTTRRRRAAA